VAARVAAAIRVVAAIPVAEAAVVVEAAGTVSSLKRSLRPIQRILARFLIVFPRSTNRTSLALSPD
jgi:hypothetical protein